MCGLSDQRLSRPESCHIIIFGDRMKLRQVERYKLNWRVAEWLPAETAI